MDEHVVYLCPSSIKLLYLLAKNTLEEASTAVQLDHWRQFIKTLKKQFIADRLKNINADALYHLPPTDLLDRNVLLLEAVQKGVGLDSDMRRHVVLTLIDEVAAFICSQQNLQDGFFSRGSVACSRMKSSLKCWQNVSLFIRNATTTIWNVS